MTTQAEPESDRVELARLALTAALGQPGIASARAGAGLPRVTLTRSGSLLSGVSVSAAPKGCYEVDLRLVAELVPLDSLADRIRRRVATAANRHGLAGLLGAVNIEFIDLATPGDSPTDSSASNDPAAPATADPQPTHTHAAVAPAVSGRAPEAKP